MGSLLVLTLAVLVAGCASRNHIEQRPFFQHEYDLTTHGRKTLLDRVVEVDPGGFDVDVSPEYMSDPPARIAVLPFSDEGSANFVVNKISLTYRSPEQRHNWAWTDAQRLRRAMQGYLAQREFVVANLYGVDAVMQDRGIKNMADLNRVSAQELGDWLDVDAVVYGRVVHYEAYYLLLVAGWQVGIDMKLVSTKNGKTLIDASGSRWSVSVMPALEAQDIAINAALNILALRDINLARAEEEACRELVRRIPQSDKLMNEMVERAREHAIRVGTRRRLLDQLPQSSFVPSRSYPVIIPQSGGATITE